MEWLISRVCEEFGCLPSQAIRELERDPLQLALQIVDLRGYARAKAEYERLKTSKEARRLLASPVVRLVRDIEFELLREALDQDDSADSPHGA